MREVTSDTPALVVCDHAERCPGCPAIGLPYAEQLANKGRRVSRAVGRYPALEGVRVEAVAGADPVVGYRTRAKLMVGTGGRLGLYAAGHDVVDIPRCRVLAPPLARVADAVRRLVRQAGSVGEVLGSALHAIDLREVCDGAAVQVLVTLVVQRERAGHLEPLREAARVLMREAHEVVGVAANYHEGDAPQVLGKETVLLAGAASAQDRTGGSVTMATYGSFVQAHRGQAARIHALLLEAVAAPGRQPPGRRPRVLDVFGGSGAIAMGLAAAGASVHVVESFGPAVAQVRAAAQAQGLDVRADQGDAAAVVRSLAERGEPFDAVVVNPPRRGLSPDTREWLARLQAPVVAYVSCDPDTLARDLDHLTRLGYGPTALRPLDMIPLTDEVETVAVLARAPAPPAHPVYEDDEVFVAEKCPHEPTTPQGEYRGSLLARVRSARGNGEAVPVHRLDVGTSGLVVFARRPELVAGWQAALASPDARKVYVAAVRGVTSAKGTVARSLRDGRHVRGSAAAWSKPGGGKARPARTRYRRLFIEAGHSVLRVVPEQGRTHQIRRHLAAIGHPVLGDARHGHAPSNRYFEEKYGLDRTFLHCARIELTHPRTGAALVLEAPVPGDLLAVTERAFGSALSCQLSAFSSGRLKADR
jgi:23S rRNA (uracil1939-C5)-methyltransferase